jgi:acetyl-CoA C-acetyltransferase
MPQFRSGVYIYDAVRTPKARVRRHGGTLADVPAYDLLGQLFVALQQRGLSTHLVDDVLIGTSTAVGDQGGNVARAAALWAGWPDDVPAGVVGRLCCAGLDAVESATAKVAAGVADVVVAGGIESMSRVPMLSDEPAFAHDDTLGERTGYVPLGVSADLTAAGCRFTRTDLDAVALRSHQRALRTTSTGSVVPVRAGGATVLAADEGARADVTAAFLAELPPLFGDDPAWDRVARRLPDSARPGAGLHTAATAPQLADGAAVVVLGTRHAADSLGRQPIAEIVGVAQVAVRSPWLTAAALAANQAVKNAGITAAALDVVEANESFAASVLLVMRELGLGLEEVNRWGGSLATGHPLGAGGAVLLVNAVDQLAQTDGEYALVTIPAALGLGAAVVIRRVR